MKQVDLQGDVWDCSIGNFEAMPKFYDLESMTQEDLNKLALERNTYIKIIDELEKDIKEDNQKAREYMKKVEQSGMCQGDYPVHYYYADKRIGLTEKYLERLKELKGGKE